MKSPWVWRGCGCNGGVGGFIHKLTPLSGCSGEKKWQKSEGYMVVGAFSARGNREEGLMTTWQGKAGEGCNTLTYILTCRGSAGNSVVTATQWIQINVSTRTGSQVTSTVWSAIQEGTHSTERNVIRRQWNSFAVRLIKSLKINTELK